MEEESQTSLVHHLRFGLTLPVMLMLVGRRARQRRAGSVVSCRDTGTRSDALAEMFARRRVVDAPGPVGHFGPQRPVLRAAIPKHEHPVQKAQDHSDGGEIFSQVDRVASHPSVQTVSRA